MEVVRYMKVGAMSKFSILVSMYHYIMYKLHSYGFESPTIVGQVASCFLLP
jgi:hypothetical protein